MALNGLAQRPQTFPLKGQIGNILGFAGHLASITTHSTVGALKPLRAEYDY